MSLGGERVQGKPGSPIPYGFGRPLVVPTRFAANLQHLSSDPINSLDLSVTLNNLSSSATVTNTNQATATFTLGALTVAAVATNTNSAASSLTLSAVTTTATVTNTVVGSTSITLGALTTASADSVLDQAGLTSTLANVSLSSVTTVTQRATLSVTLASVTLRATTELAVVYGGTSRFVSRQEPKRIKVKSTNLKSVVFDKDSNELIVKFKNNEEYSYANVPKKAFDRLLNADSKGKHFHNKMKGKYLHRKI